MPGGAESAAFHNFGHDNAVSSPGHGRFESHCSQDAERCEWQIAQGGAQ